MHTKQPFQLLWHSNSRKAPTGYGNQTGLFTPLILADEDYAISGSAFYGVQGGPLQWPDGYVEMPMAKDTYGNDVIEAHYQRVKAQMVVSLIDPFVLDPQIWTTLNWCAWVPIDSAPIPTENLVSIRAAKWLWAMSEFGKEQLEMAGFKNVLYVPHGVDTEAFKPIDRTEARKRMGFMLQTDLEGKFLFICVAANKGSPSRKNFSLLIEMFAQFAKEHTDAVLYIHTDPRGVMHGDDLFHLRKVWGVEDKVFFPSEYHYQMGLFSDVALNDFYNAADCKILLSGGEGFGIPIIEAQAAGCPVIVTDGSAMSELCLSGWKVPGVPMQAWDGRLGCKWWWALPPEVLKAMEAAYANRDNDAPRKLARQQALAYDHKVVYQLYMKPALDKMRDETLGKMKPVDLKAKRKRRKQRKASVNGLEKVQA